MNSPQEKVRLDALTDSRISAIEWLNDGDDLAVHFRLPGPRDETHQATLVGRWVRKLRIDLNFGDTTDMGLVWEVSAKLADAKSHLLVVDCGGPPGHLEFLCDSYELRRLDDHPTTE